MGEKDRKGCWGRRKVGGRRGMARVVQSWPVWDRRGCVGLRHREQRDVVDAFGKGTGVEPRGKAGG